MTTTETIMLGLLTVGILPLNVKIVFDWLKSRSNGNSIASKVKCPIEINGLIGDMRRLEEIYTKTDEDGIPLGYFPRHWGRKLDTVIEVLQDIKEAIVRRPL